jgi:protein-S-isoprenylcysteine O-methyltransferase Ste14
MIHKEKYSYLFIAGVILFAIGALNTGWSLLIFRSSKTTTVPGRASPRLVTSGVYRQGRNPMYVGLIFADAEHLLS